MELVAAIWESAPGRLQSSWQQVDRLVSLQINQDGFVALTLSPCPVIHPKGTDGRTHGGAPTSWWVAGRSGGAAWQAAGIAGSRGRSDWNAGHGTEMGHTSIASQRCD